MARNTPRTWRRVKLLVTLLAVSAFLFLMPARFTAPARLVFTEAVGPLETAAFHAAGDALATGGTLTDMFRRAERDRALERRVAELANENARLEDVLRRQQRRLESVQELQLAQMEFRAVSAPVTGYDTSPLRHGIVVRAGRRAGVRPGMAVTAGGALVGVVQEAGLWQCRVRLITDPQSTIPCRLSSSRAVCILQGTGQPACRVDWIDRDGFVERGDVVVTAALEAEGAGEPLLPEGLPAATVTEVGQQQMNPLFYDVKAAPRVNLERLEQVEILVPEAESSAGGAQQ